MTWRAFWRGELGTAATREDAQALCGERSFAIVVDSATGERWILEPETKARPGGWRKTVAQKAKPLPDPSDWPAPRPPRAYKDD